MMIFKLIFGLPLFLIGIMLLIHSAIEGWRESEDNNFFWRLLDAIFAVLPSSGAIRFSGAVGSILLLLGLVIILIK